MQTGEVEGGFHRDKILEFLERIPQSADNIYIGPLKINPSLIISGTYDDNVLNASSRPVPDFYNTYEPKISLTLPVRDHSIAFDYGYTIYEYEGSNSTRLAEQDRVNRNFGGSMSLNFANGFSIYLADKVSIVRTPGGGVTRRNNQRVQFPGDDPIDEPDNPDEIEELFGINMVRAPREVHNNNASISVDLPDFFDKLDFKLIWKNFDASYKQRDAKINDRNVDTFIGKATITPLPKIDIVTGFDYSYIRYDSSFQNDSIYRRIPFDISWHPTVKSTFFFNSRYNHRDYGRRSLFKNFSGYDATLGYRFNVTQRDNLTTKIERSVKEQQFQTRTISSTERVPDTNPYLYTQLNIEWRHKLSDSFSIMFSPSFQHIRFREKQFFTSKSGVAVLKHEKVDTVKFQIKGKYRAPGGWLFSEISYNYQDRNSNLVGGDMIKNVFQISVGLNL